MLKLACLSVLALVVFAQDCRDSNANCATYKASGYCANPQMASLMQTNCRMTCQICTKPTIAVASTGTCCGVGLTLVIDQTDFNAPKTVCLDVARAAPYQSGQAFISFFGLACQAGYTGIVIAKSATPPAFTGGMCYDSTIFPR